MEIGLSIGCNIGDRAANLHAIRSALASAADIEIAAESPIYETDPVDVPDEHADKPFLNAVIIVESGVAPTELAARFRAIEERLGRPRTDVRNTPRPADIDIIYAGDQRIDTPRLTVPHPRWRQRRFVVQPLADIRPDLVLPGDTRTVAEILLTLPDTPKVVRYSGQ